MTPLPPAFLHAPFAHRAYHDASAGRAENSPAAIRAAVTAGYGIEIDVQPSRDNVAMVFHDYDLKRLTGETGPIRQRTAKALGEITLAGGPDTIPTLSEVLDIIDGQVPLLIELKDQDGAMGPDIGALEQSVESALSGYTGPVALMSFNPHSVAALADRMPDRPRGLTTCAFLPDDWPILNAATRRRLAGIPDVARVGASFISHDVRDLASARVSEIKAQGIPILCWTVRSRASETQAREIADNVTFEGYAAPIPA